MTLRLVPDLPDPVSKPLPPKWDGLPIFWSRWYPSPHVFSCPPEPSDGCPECGFKGAGWHATAGTTLRTYHAAGRSERTISLRAERCAMCLFDQVIDLDTFETWDLDPLDYGPDGSRDWSTS